MISLSSQRHVFFAASLTALAAIASPAQADDTGWQNKYFEAHITRNSGKQTIRANLGGPGSAARPSLSGRDIRQSRRSTPPGIRTASLGRPEAPQRSRPVSGGGGVNWVANSGCLAGSLKSVIHSIAASFGSVTVSSTCRSAGHNRRVGGATRSHHLTGNAADFRVHGNTSAAYATLRSSGSVGGLKHYGGGLFHIDTGARRSW